MLWLYDIVLFAKTLIRDVQKLKIVLEEFCMHTKSSFNDSKNKDYACKGQKKDKTCIRYNNEPLKCVERFKYLYLEAPSYYRWNECVIRH